MVLGDTETNRYHLVVFGYHLSIAVESCTYSCNVFPVLEKNKALFIRAVSIYRVSIYLIFRYRCWMLLVLGLAAPCSRRIILFFNDSINEIKSK